MVQINKINSNLSRYINILFCIALFLTCTKDRTIEKYRIREFKEVYGLNFNPIRLVIGLELLNTQFKLYSYPYNNIMGDGTFDWVVKTNEFPNYINKSCFLGKKSVFKFNIIISESDLYTSSKFYDAFNIVGKKDKVIEVLSYTYHFHSFGNQIKFWSYYFFTTQDALVRGNITKCQADSILHSWGLFRHGNVSNLVLTK